MKLQDQVCTEPQGDRLKELGIDQESLFYHTHSDKWGVLPRSGIDFSGDPSSAFTVAELGIMLPAGYDSMRISDDGWRGYDLNGRDFPPDTFRTEAGCRVAMIIDLLETEVITVEEVNARLCAEQ